MSDGAQGAAPGTLARFGLSAERSELAAREREIRACVALDWLCFAVIREEHEAVRVVVPIDNGDRFSELCGDRLPIEAR